MRALLKEATGESKRLQREGNVDDVFSYDFADQMNGVQISVANPSGVQSIPRMTDNINPRPCLYCACTTQSYFRWVTAAGKL
jgi:hypothetical protein